MKKNYTDIGQVIEIDLGQYGYSGFFAECLYSVSETPNCMSIMIAIIRKGEDVPLDYLIFAGTEQPDGSTLYRQDIHSSKGTIKNDLCRIVSYMCSSGVIKEYVE